MARNERGSPIVSTHDVMLVQEALQGAGHYRGPIDGIAGSKTLNATRAYRKAHGMPLGILLDDDFIAHVRYQT